MLGCVAAKKNNKQNGDAWQGRAGMEVLVECSKLNTFAVSTHSPDSRILMCLACQLHSQ